MVPPPVSTSVYMTHPLHYPYAANAGCGLACDNDAVKFSKCVNGIRKNMACMINAKKRLESQTVPFVCSDVDIVIAIWIIVFCWTVL